MAKVVIFVNVDHFFVTHRMGIGLALRDAGLDVVVAAADTGASREIRARGLRFEPIPIGRSSRAPHRELAAIAAVAAVYRRERPDVVQHASIKALMYGSWVARALGIPAINTISGLGYAMIQRANDRVAQRALREAVKVGYRLAFRGERIHNVFQNPEQLDQFVALGLVDRASTILIRGSGVDVERFQPAPLPDDAEPLVVMPGRMLWDKGVAEFVAAARALRGRGVRARFALVGGEDAGNPARVPRAEIDRWTREGVVEWWGHRDDLPDVFRRAMLVVLPSYAEGMPLALAEAAATARAVIASDVPGCREVAIDGVTGWRVPVADADALAKAIAEAVSDRERLARFGANARAHVERTLARAVVVRDMLALYRRVLGDRWPQ